MRPCCQGIKQCNSSCQAISRKRFWWQPKANLAKTSPDTETPKVEGQQELCFTRFQYPTQSSHYWPKQAQTYIVTIQCKAAKHSQNQPRHANFEYQNQRKGLAWALVGCLAAWGSETEPSAPNQALLSLAGLTWPWSQLSVDLGRFWLWLAALGWILASLLTLPFGVRHHVCAGVSGLVLAIVGCPGLDPSSC